MLFSTHNIAKTAILTTFIFLYNLIAINQVHANINNSNYKILNSQSDKILDGLFKTPVDRSGIDNLIKNSRYPLPEFMGPETLTTGRKVEKEKDNTPNNNKRIAVEISDMLDNFNSEYKIGEQYNLKDSGPLVVVIPATRLQYDSLSQEQIEKGIEFMLERAKTGNKNDLELYQAIKEKCDYNSLTGELFYGLGKLFLGQERIVVGCDDSPYGLRDVSDPVKENKKTLFDINTVNEVLNLGLEELNNEVEEHKKRKKFFETYFGLKPFLEFYEITGKLPIVNLQEKYVSDLTTEKREKYGPEFIMKSGWIDYINLNIKDNILKITETYGINILLLTIDQDKWEKSGLFSLKEHFEGSKQSYLEIIPKDSSVYKKVF